MSQIGDITNALLKKTTALGLQQATMMLSQLYPVDFECFMIAFELCDSKGTTLDYFTFPIMPTDLSIEEEIPVKVENTFGGVNTISSNVYVPKSINLSGTFGRKFRIISRSDITIPFAKSNKTIQERDYGVKGVKREELEISNSIKTGFGSFKVLQSIINRAVEVDSNGECNKLYMYNAVYGENYLVKPLNFRGSQSISHNGMWNYELSLKAVCPLHLDAHREGKSILVYSSPVGRAKQIINKIKPRK